MLLRVRLVQIILIALLVQPVSAVPSPDFDESGVVDFTDFLLFVSAFGARESQERYDAKYDLNGDGEIGFGDFLIFGRSFGKEG
jgi:Ca2+-binding EF-hand superfamily protein